MQMETVVIEGKIPGAGDSGIAARNLQFIPIMNAPNTDYQESTQEVIDKVKTIASERCHNACDRTKKMIRENPVPTVLGALVFGAAIGYLVLSRREETSLYDRLIHDSASARRRLAAAPGRLSSIFHDGLDAASRRASRASDYIHDLPTDEVVDSVSSSLNRLANRLKFW